MGMARLRFSLVLHNHQPVGNFDGVIENAYHDSYLPFLEVLEQFPDIPFCLHTSGPLLEWFVAHKPDYIDRLRRLVQTGQVEILGGGYYEPILSMIPPRDRVGQIRGFTEYLREIFECEVRGMWIAERVWEQSLVSDLADAQIQYTILDDYHFRKAGLPAEALAGHYITEDQGKLLRLFPGSESARYLIPFRDVSDVMGYFSSIRERGPNALVVFADDGEKFGTWPETKAHVYERGWLWRFLEALRHNRDWLEVATLSDAIDSMAPLGKTYLPDCSYREMTEWALPVNQKAIYQRSFHEMDHHSWGRELRAFLQGGAWRNFKVHYPETNDMYARMMEVSQKLHELGEAVEEASGDETLYRARVALYRGQCNCAYWHGAFGGLYLPHLRNAIYENLIEADNQLEVFQRSRSHAGPSAKRGDWNLDGHEEVRLANDHMVVYVAPDAGGQIYELDVRDAKVNLGAALARRPEPYHEKIRCHSSGQGGDVVASIHDHCHSKVEGLDQRIVYDHAPRRILVDHFLPEETTIEAARTAQWIPLGDFWNSRYRVEGLRRAPDPTLSLIRDGRVDGRPMTLRKSIQLACQGSLIRVRYDVQGEPSGHGRLFAVESTIAALASRAEDRFVLDGNRKRIGSIGDVMELGSGSGVFLVDEWLGVEVGIRASAPAMIWMFPVETVSQSEGGFEPVHQGCGVVFTWRQPVNSANWSLELHIETRCFGRACGTHVREVDSSRLTVA